jgi:hypothetical protein
MVNMGLGSEFKVGVVAILNIGFPGLLLDFIAYSLNFRARCDITPPVICLKSVGRRHNSLWTNKIIEI